MASQFTHLRVVVYILYVIFVVISINNNVLCINKTHRHAIEKSESIVFPKNLDLEFQKFEVFQQFFEREDGNNAFTSLDNSDFTVLVTEKDADFGLVILGVENPPSDAVVGKICYVTTYIVFRPIKNFIDHFTSHIAHVRNIHGKTSLEWDFFFSRSREWSGNFASAFSPDNEVPDRIIWSNKGRMMRRLKKKKLDNKSTDPTTYTTEAYIPKQSLTVFEGLGRCTQTNELSLNPIQSDARLLDYEIIEYILDVLQVNCLPGFYEKTKKLFDMKLVVPFRGIRVSLNKSHPLMNSAFLTEQQWMDLVSAIYLYSFANSFTITMNPVRTTLVLSDVSPSVRNLIGMSVQMIELIKKNRGIQLHSVKIITTMLITAKAAIQNYANERDNLAGCLECDYAASLNQNNTAKVSDLIKILQCKVEKLLVP